MGTKTAYFYMKLSDDQKEILREQANSRNMSMTQYIWYLITKDKEKIDAKR